MSTKSMLSFNLRLPFPAHLYSYWQQIYSLSQTVDFGSLSSNINLC